jgi:hypothetical protein
LAARRAYKRGYNATKKSAEKVVAAPPAQNDAPVAERPRQRRRVDEFANAYAPAGLMIAATNEAERIAEIRSLTNQIVGLEEDDFRRYDIIDRLRNLETPAETDARMEAHHARMAHVGRQQELGAAANVLGMNFIEAEQDEFGDMGDA